MNFRTDIVAQVTTPKRVKELTQAEIKVCLAANYLNMADRELTELIDNVEYITIFQKELPFEELDQIITLTRRLKLRILNTMPEEMKDAMRMRT